jgi:hypothetical protein
MPMKLKFAALAASLLSISTTALAQAQVAVAVPEPGILELAAVAAVIGYIVHRRNRK